MISVVVADDESVARSRLRRLLSREADVKIVGECANGQETVEAILDHSPNLVFLDIQMPAMTGFQVIESLPAASLPAFVFVTAFSNYAIDAFRVEALDYLLKPFSTERFLATMTRARQLLAGAPSGQRQLLSAIRELSDTQDAIRAAVSTRDVDTASVHSRYLERVAVKANGRVYFVRVADVDYIEAAANYVKLHTGTDVHMIRQKLGELAARLDPSLFLRIHRATIVNLDRIKEIQPWFSGDAIVILQTGKKLRLSRVFRSGLELGTRTRF